MMLHKTLILTVAPLVLASAASAATVTLLNGDFATGTGQVATNWTHVNGSGTNNAPSNYWANDIPNVFGGTIQIKSDGGNYIQQVLTASNEGALNATSFNSYTINFEYGYRQDAVRNGDHTLRISLWNTTDNVEITGQNLLIADPLSVGANSLTNGSIVLNYDNTAGSLAGDSIAIRFTSTSGDLAGNAWQRTAILDNIAITAVPEPSVALLGGLGLLGLARRRRA